MSVYENVFSKDLLDTLKELPEVLAAKEKLGAATQNVVYFNIPLTQELRSALESRFGLNLASVSSVPMRWLKGDTEPHMDTGRAAFQTTHLVYLNDSEGELVIGDSTLPITQNTGYTFQQGTLHGARNTGTAPRLLLGPMSETAQSVGQSVTYYFTSKEDAETLNGSIANYGGYEVVTVSGFSKWRLASNSTGTSPQTAIYNAGDTLAGSYDDSPIPVYYLYPYVPGRQQIRTGSNFQVFTDGPVTINITSATLHLRPYPYAPNPLIVSNQMMKGLYMFYTLTLEYDGTMDASGGQGTYTTTLNFTSANGIWTTTTDALNFNLDGTTQTLIFNQDFGLNPGGSYIEATTITAIDTITLNFESNALVTFVGDYTLSETWYINIPTAGSGNYSTNQQPLVIVAPSVDGEEESVNSNFYQLLVEARVANSGGTNLDTGSTNLSFKLDGTTNVFQSFNNLNPLIADEATFITWDTGVTDAGNPNWTISDIQIIVDDGQ